MERKRKWEMCQIDNNQTIEQHIIFTTYTGEITVRFILHMVKG